MPHTKWGGSLPVTSNKSRTPILANAVIRQGRKHPLLALWYGAEITWGYAVVKVWIATAKLSPHKRWRATASRLSRRVSCLEPNTAAFSWL